MNYQKEINRIGMIFTYAGFLLLASVPFAISVYLDVWPTFTMIIAPLLSILAIYLPVQLIEIGTYVPMLGQGGSYLAFITGNISNLKAPCVMNSLEANKAEAGSEEGEIISTIAVASSSIVTTIVLALGVLLFVTTDLASLLSAPVLGPAFDNILGALFGALGVVFIGKNFKIAIVPLVVMLIVFVIMPETYSSIVSVLIPVAAGISIGWARFLYKKGKI